MVGSDHEWSWDKGFQPMKYRSRLRDLIEKIEAASRDHFAYSQAADVIKVAMDHLAARARIEEMNNKKAPDGADENEA